MSRKNDILNPLLDNLSKQIKFGQSKYDDKQKAMEAFLKGEGEKSDYLHPKGLYSYKTFQTYREDVVTFVNWVMSHKEVKNARTAKQYVHKYLKDKIAKGQSPWTIHKVAHALARAFDCEVKDFGVELPTRARAGITRSRGPVKSDRLAHTKYDEEVREFSRATGARRGGFAKLRACDLREREGGGYEVFLQEKGGKERWARVLPHREEIVLRKFDEARIRGDEALVFEHPINSHIDVHSCRGEYSREMYDTYKAEGRESGKLYRCRGDRYGEIYDKGLLLLVSRDMGHNRCDVIVSHYLK